jgi:hypothetical protein
MRHVAILCVTLGCLSFAPPTQQGPRQDLVTATGATQQQRPISDAAALETRLAAANAELDETLHNNFLFDEGVQAVDEARAQLRQRLNGCLDEPCRVAILTEEVNRIEYGFGRNAGPVADMPWETGLLDLRVPTFPFGEFSGQMNIYPLVGKQLLILFSGIAVPTGQWDCSMAAVGHLRPGPIVEMRALDEPHDRFVFRPVGANRWSMEAPEPNKRTYCGAWGSVVASYDVEVIRDRPERRDPSSSGATASIPDG